MCQLVVFHQTERVPLIVLIVLIELSSVICVVRAVHAIPLSHHLDW